MFELTIDSTLKIIFKLNILIKLSIKFLCRFYLFFFFVLFIYFFFFFYAIDRLYLNRETINISVHTHMHFQKVPHIKT